MASQRHCLCLAVLIHPILAVYILSVSCENGTNFHGNDNHNRLMSSQKVSTNGSHTCCDDTKMTVSSDVTKRYSDTILVTKITSVNCTVQNISADLHLNKETWIDCSNLRNSLNYYYPTQNRLWTNATDVIYEFTFNMSSYGFYCGQLTIDMVNTITREPCQTYYATPTRNYTESGDIPAKATHSVPKIIGTIIALLLFSVAVGFIVWNRRRKLKTRVNSARMSVINESGYEQLHQDVPERKVMVVAYPQDKENEDGLVDLIGTLQRVGCKVINALEEEHLIATFGINAWTAKSIRDADAIIILNSDKGFQCEQARRSGENLLEGGICEKVFSTAINMLMTDQTLRTNYDKVFNVRYSTTDKESVIRDIVPERHYLLPNATSSLLSHVLKTDVYFEILPSSATGNSQQQ